MRQAPERHFGKGFMRSQSSGNGDGVIEIAYIMINGAAAGGTADDGSVEFPDLFSIDFSGGILIASNDDGVGIASEHEKPLVMIAGQNFFKRKIVRGIQIVVDKEFHISLYFVF